MRTFITLFSFTNAIILCFSRLLMNEDGISALNLVQR